MEDLDWPPQVPDLNHIPHLWDDQVVRLQACPYRPATVMDLTDTDHSLMQVPQCDGKAETGGVEGAH